MDMRLIGTVRDNLRNIVGFRILERKSKQIKDVPVDILKKAIRQKGIQVEGLSFKRNKIEGSNGSLDRYPQIIYGNLVGKSPVVILERITRDGNTVGYTASDWKGQIKVFRVREVIQYANKHGISNGAVRKLENGEIISSIQGEYKTIQRKETGESIQEMEKSIWTMEDFIDYMDRNNLGYEVMKVYSGDEIDFKVDRARVLKYPDGVTSVDRCFSADKIKVDTIILSPSIETVWVRLLEKAEGLRRIVIQEGATEIRYTGIRRFTFADENVVDTLKEIVFPSTLKVIGGGFNNIKSIEKLDLRNTSLKEIEDSFRGLENLKELYLPNDIKRIGDSLRGLKSLRKIRLPDNLERVTFNSFDESSEVNLNLTNCTKLRTIGVGAFSKSKNLMSVRLPDNLKTIEDIAFDECDLLSRVIFPKNIERIESAFKGTSIQEFTINNNLKYLDGNAFNDSTTIKFGDDVEEIRDVIRLPGFRNVEIPDNVRKIGTRAFHNSVMLEQIKIPKNVTELGDQAFEKCKRLQSIQFEESSKLKKIGRWAFVDTGLKSIILPDGLEEIGDNCFNGSYRLEYMVIPKSVKKIGASALSNIGNATDLGTEILVYEDSLALDYCKRNRYNYRIIDSLDDIEPGEEGSTDKRQQAKARLLLSNNDKHRELVEPKFIAHSQKLLDIYKKVTSLDYEDYNYTSLNTNKMIDFPVDQIKILDDTMAELGRKGTRDVKVNLQKGILQNRFITLSNYITKLFDFNHMPLTTKAMDFMQNEMDYRIATIHDDGVCRVLVIHAVYPGDHGVRPSIPIILMGDRIKFVGLTTLETGTPLHDKLKAYEQGVGVDPEVRWKEPIIDTITTGDVLRSSWNEESIINGSPLPEYIREEIWEVVKEQLIVVGTSNIPTRAKRRRNDVADLEFMCIKTGKIIQARAGHRTYSYGNAQQIGDITNIAVRGITNINNIDESTLQKLRLGMENRKTEEFFKLISLEDEYTDSLKNKDGAYDNDPTYEWELSQALNKHGMTYANQLSPGAFKTLEDTTFVSRSRRSIKEMDKNSVDKEEIPLDDGMHRIIQYRLSRTGGNKRIPKGKIRYTSVLVENGADKEKKRFFYNTYNTIQQTLDIITSMKQEYREYLGIDDLRISDHEYKQKYVELQEQVNPAYLMFDGHSASIAVCRCNGAAYLMGRRIINGGSQDIRFKLLRYKDLESAILNNTWMNVEIHKKRRREEREADDIRYNMAYLIDSLYTKIKRTDRKKTEIEKLRDDIMKGLPNGHYTKSYELEHWDDLAKQK